MILDRISVLTDEVSPNLTEALDWISSQGLKWVEIRMVDGANVVTLTDEQVARVRKEAEKRGLRISAIASPFLKCMLDPSRPVPTGDTFGNKEEDVATHFGRLPRTAEIARRLGTKFIRIFSFWREQDPRKHEAEIVGHLRKAAGIAAQHDVVLCLENEGACNGGTAEEIARFVKEVNHPALRALWDPGNEDYFGLIAWPDGYEKVRGLFAHVHLKDVVFDKEGKANAVPIGSGRVRLKEQIQALEKDGYKGIYTMEPRYTPPGGTPLQGTQMAFDGLKKLLKEGNLL